MILNIEYIFPGWWSVRDSAHASVGVVVVLTPACTMREGGASSQAGVRCQLPDLILLQIGNLCCAWLPQPQELGGAAGQGDDITDFTSIDQVTPTISDIQRSQWPQQQVNPLSKINHHNSG